MSYGIVICSVCKHEVHQHVEYRSPTSSEVVKREWRHCDTKTVICDGGSADYPDSLHDIKGKWCGKDDGPAGRLTEFKRAAIRQAAPSAKIGRNDYCPCGSGKKYKRCCIK